MEPMATSTTSFAPARDAAQILVRRWLPTVTPWAHVLLVHGIHEHSGRYEQVGAWLASAGLDVTAYDQRGAGASDGRRAWIRQWSDIHDDVEDRLAAVRAIASGGPVVLYGHSLGGLIALGYCVADPPRPLPDALVLSAPAIDSTAPRWQHALAAVLDRVRPTFTLMDTFDGSLLSSDAGVGEAYRTDPLAFHGTTARLGAELFREQRRVRAAASRLSIPTFVYHGDADPIVPVAATEPLARIPGVTRRTWPGLRHETHNEPEGEQVVAEAVAWLRSVLESGDN